MNHLLRPRIWLSFLASSGVGPCDVPFRYASEPIPRYRGTVARWHAHLRGLATAIHEISGPLTFGSRILFGSFFHLAKLLGDYLVVRIKFAGFFEGVNCLWPLVADSIKTA